MDVEFGVRRWKLIHIMDKKYGDSEGQRSLLCCSAYSHRESDTNYRLKNKQKTTIRSYGRAQGTVFSVLGKEDE